LGEIKRIVLLFFDASKKAEQVGLLKETPITNASFLLRVQQALLSL
jgi:hypothetical protein